MINVLGLSPSIKHKLSVGHSELGGCNIVTATGRMFNDGRQYPSQDKGTERCTVGHLFQNRGQYSDHSTACFTVYV